MSKDIENGLCHIKTRSLSKIFDKPCVRFRGHISCPKFLKVGKNTFLDDVSENFENGHVEFIKTSSYETWSECLPQ